MSVLLFQKLIPYYRIAVFKNLFQSLGIVTCHSLGLKGSSNKSFNERIDFPTEILPSLYYQKKETSLIQSILPVIRKYKPGIVITEFSFRYLTFWCLYLVRKRFRFKLIIWTHGISNHDLDKPFHGIKGRLRKYIFLKVDAMIVYSQQRAELIRANLKTNNIFIAKNTIDLTRNFEVYNKLSISGKRNIRKKLGFKEKYHIVFIGRLVKAKRLDILLEVYMQLVKTIDVALHIIGDGPETKIFKNDNYIHNGIYLYGELYNVEETGEIIYSSDLMVYPGAVGLAILHSFSMGIPLIAFNPVNNIPPHGPEIECLENRKNGVLCEIDTGIMAEEIKDILLNPMLLESMQNNALSTAKEYSIDRFLSGFAEAIDYCKKEK
jgi:glycosyltransferase involved in cell wall biosynthesis